MENGGNFTMEGGIISGNSAYFGGGVYVSGGDSDTMGGRHLYFERRYHHRQ